MSSAAAPLRLPTTAMPLLITVFSVLSLVGGAIRAGEMTDESTFYEDLFRDLLKRHNGTEFRLRIAAAGVRRDVNNTIALVTEACNAHRAFTNHEDNTTQIGREGFLRLDEAIIFGKLNDGKYKEFYSQCPHPANSDPEYDINHKYLMTFEPRSLNQAKAVLSHFPIFSFRVDIEQTNDDTKIYYFSKRVVNLTMDDIIGGQCQVFQGDKIINVNCSASLPVLCELRYPKMYLRDTIKLCGHVKDSLKYVMYKLGNCTNAYKSENILELSKLTAQLKAIRSSNLIKDMKKNDGYYPTPKMNMGIGHAFMEMELVLDKILMSIQTLSCTNTTETEFTDTLDDTEIPTTETTTSTETPNTDTSQNTAYSNKIEMAVITTIATVTVNFLILTLYLVWEKCFKPRMENSCNCFKVNHQPNDHQASPRRRRGRTREFFAETENLPLT